MLTEDELGDRLRGHFHDLTDGHVPAREVAASVIRGVRRRRFQKGALLGAVAVVAGGTLAGIANDSAHSPQGVTLKLASYSFRLPAGSRLSATAVSSCMAEMEVRHAKPGLNIVGLPYSSRQIASAVTAQGGCVVMTLSVNYTPSSAIPDAFEPSGSSPTTVGKYHAWIDKRVAAPGTHWTSGVEVGVRLPAGDGTIHDLVVGARGIPVSELVNIVTQGLSS